MGSSLPIRSWLADRANVATLAALVFITLLAGVARIAPLPNEPLWLDELHTSWTVIAELSDVAPRARLGNQSPLYFYLPWLTTHTLGQNELALRLPSLIAGLALVPMVFAAATWFSSSRLAGITAALLVALDQDCIFYAQEARPYALVQLLAVINALCFWRLLSVPSLAIRSAWILTGTFLFYTHYTAALILVAEGVYLGGLILFIWVRGYWFPTGRSGDASPISHRVAAKTAISKLLQVAFDATVLVMLCLPSLPHLLEIFGRRQNWNQFISTPDWADFGDLMPFVPLAVLPVITGIVALFLRARQHSSMGMSEPSPRALLFLICWFVFPVAFITLTTGLDLAPLFHRRYIIGVLPGAIIFAASMTLFMPNRGVRLAYLVVIVSASVALNEPLVTLAQTGTWPSARNQNWRAAIELITSSATKSDRLYVYTGLLESQLYSQISDPLAEEYCVLPVRGLHQVPREMYLRSSATPFSSYYVASSVVLPWQLGKGDPTQVNWFLTTTPIDADLRGEKIKEEGDAWNMNFLTERHEFGEVIVLRVTARPNLSASAEP